MTDTEVLLLILDELRAIREAFEAGDKLSPAPKPPQTCACNNPVRWTQPVTISQTSMRDPY